MNLPLSTRRSWVEPNPDYSVRRQCRLAGVTRSGIYCESAPETAENLLLMRLIDEQYMRHPKFGYPRMTDWLRDEDHDVNHKRVARLTLFKVVTSGWDTRMITYHVLRIIRPI